MNIFGWSYPAGCNGPPEDEEHAYCLYCGKGEYDCDCPECKVCGAAGDPDCRDSHDYQTDIVWSLQDLCDRRYDRESDNPKHAAQIIAKYLFKYTDSGVSFWSDPNSNRIVVSGYCEGTDQECPSHDLEFPFTQTEFAEAIQQSDDDAKEVWGQTHGCEDCAKVYGCDEFGNPCEGYDGLTPVNPDCKNPDCMGHGICI